MKLDFGDRRITIVLAPVDMRYGCGGWLLYRRLHQQKFARFMAKLESQTVLNFTADEVISFLDGKSKTG